MPAYKYTKGEFVETAIAVHGERYGYDYIEQPHLSKRNKIVCHKHGLFEQKGQHHLAGAGCPTCAKESYSGENSPGRKAYRKRIGVENAAEFRIDQTKVTFVCGTHGEVQISRFRFERYGALCKYCEEATKPSKQEQSDFQKYRKQVRRFTERSWNNRNGYINHGKIKRGKIGYHLDHNFSVYDGFQQNIPPYIVGHWSNLELIPYDQNIRKGSNSIIDSEFLISLFYYNYHKHDCKRIY